MIDIVVPVSGGKDSQACLKLAVEEYGPDKVQGLFCDTKFEHPLTYRHIYNMHRLYNVKVDVVCGGSVIEKCRKYKRFPGGGARFCTEELKMRETKIYCKRVAEQQRQGFQVWYGMRVEESINRKKKYSGLSDTELFDMHELFPSKYPKYLAKLEVYMRLPIVNYSEQDVFNLLDGKHNPLYDLGFDRVGCFPCLAGGDGWKMKAFEFDEFGKQQREKIWTLEEEFGKSVFTSKKYKGEGCMLCAI